MPPAFQRDSLPQRAGITAALLLASLVPALAGGNIEVECVAPFLPNPTCQQGEIVDVAWYSGAIPLRWWMNEMGVRGNNTHGAIPLSPDNALAELEAAFAAWETAPETAIRFQSMGVTSTAGAALDGENVLFWSDTVLGSSTLATTFWFIFQADWPVTDSSSSRDLNGDGVEDLDRSIYPSGIVLPAGTIFEADVAFNSGDFDWSLLPDPFRGISDIRAVAVHEAGHVHGLSHSMVMRDPATMFPFFDTTSFGQQQAARTLEWDDVSASARAYPVDGAGPTGVLQGRVVTSGGAGIVGAQVAAIDLDSGRELEAVFTQAAQKVGGAGAGAYRLDRLPAGHYLISVDYLRRQGQSNRGWRWQDAQRVFYTTTLKHSNIDPADVAPELLSVVENSADDRQEALVVELGDGAQIFLPDLIANTQFPDAPPGFMQLNMDNDGIVTGIPIEFGFSFFGVPYNEFAPYANGHLTFGATLDLSFDEEGSGFLGLPRVSGLFRELDPSADGLGAGAGGPDVYVKLEADRAEVLWLSVPEEVPGIETGSPEPTPHGANTFSIGFDSSGKVWLQYQKVGTPLAIAGLSAGDGIRGVMQRYRFGRPRPFDPDRPTLEDAAKLSGIRIDFTPHALGGYVSSSPQWQAPEGAPGGAVGLLIAEGSKTTRLSWPDASVPRYHLYRGRIEDLAGTGDYTDASSCFMSVDRMEALDTGDPGPGRIFYYLVTAVREFGIEGPLGRDSSGAERINDVPCRL